MFTSDQAKVLYFKRFKRNTTPFDDHATEYDSWFDNEGSLIYSIEVQAFKDLVLDIPRPWLEIGVGSGRFAKALGIDTGIDPSSNLIDRARQKGINAFIGCGEQELFEPESFGGVFIIMTLCFLNSPTAVLHEANRILIPGGKVILGIIPAGSPWGNHYIQNKNQSHMFYKHATFLEFAEACMFLHSTGFLIEKTVSTLFQEPNKVVDMEESREGYFPDAGFIVIKAGKPA